jgi:hypothetical protein
VYIGGRRRLRKLRSIENTNSILSIDYQQNQKTPSRTSDDQRRLPSLPPDRTQVGTDFCCISLP